MAYEVDGNESLLRDLVGLFMAEYPDWMTELGQAIAGRDAARLKRVAHNLKGGLSMFGAKTAFDAALLLEAMGRTGDLAGAEDAFAALEEAIRELQPVLAAFLASGEEAHAAHSADRG